MSKISNIIARQILNSHGYPTIEVDVILDSGAFGRGTASPGESKKYLNKDCCTGEGVLQTVFNINEEIRKKLIGYDALDQRLIDQIMIHMDNSKNKKKFGKGATLAVSLACAKAAASHLHKPLYKYLMNTENYILPIPMISVINGENSNIGIKEIMIMPVGFTHFSDALRCGVKIFHTIKDIIIKEKYQVNGGITSGYAPSLLSSESALEIVIKSIDEAGYKSGKDVSIAIDLSSSRLYDNKKYRIDSEDKNLTSQELVECLSEWTEKYPIISIEDGMAKDDWIGWQLITEKLGNKIQLIGGELFDTDSKLLYQGILKKIGNSILIKSNQVATLTETFETIALANDNKYNSVMSYHLGETSDTAMADIAVATGVGQIKIGSLFYSEQIDKYNQIIRIEEELKNRALFPGIKIFNNN
jgi:enolase